ncbi:PAS domain S-box protein [Hymenobacter sp. BRD128]|uniref:PAS domain S-box protein n=1 Tax=Hymenobacter sp. BRD128 TaxID=2675878 RepID=UPI001564FA7F|nr:PAS domain S-box protein [Hymenobacter sp. BRD128]QKG58165.1 PAS domain S-box protein [Hymenobacter sp. BRD128]
MSVPHTPLPDPHLALQQLRRRAERQRLASESLPPDTPAETQRLVHELQTYQLELEMQYEELLRAQAEAERSHRQYLDVYDFAPVGYCTLAADGTLLQLNLRTSQLLGQERQRLLGRRLGLFVAPAERMRFAEFLGQLWAAPGQRQSCELAMRGPHDELFFAQLEGAATSEGDDESLPPSSCRLVLLDVTARRQATDQLAASEARFRATFEQARDGMLLLDGQRFVDINVAGLNLLGISDKRRVVGQPLAAFWPRFQPDGRRSLDMLTHCLHTAQARGWCRLVWMRYSPAGEELWDEMSFNPVLINGQPMLHAAWRDVTAAKQGEQQLRESESRLQLALAAANTGVWAWEPPSDLLYQDVRAQEILGLTLPAEPDGMLLPFGRLQQAVHPADAARVEEALGQALREHSVFDQQHRLLRPDGTVRHVAALGRFSYDERTGQPVRFVGLVRDITDRRQVEEALNYKNRLLGNILQNLPVLLARLGPDGRYREHVGQTVGRLGLAQNELVGQLAAEMFPESAAHFQRLLAGERHSYVASVVRNDQPIHLQCFGFFDEEQQEVVIFALDITEPELLKEEATRLRLRQQQELLSAILSTQEEERRRIAEGLHNGVGQLLYGTRLHLDALPPSAAVQASRLLLNEAIETTRSISFELTPSILEDFGLEVALQELVSRIPASLPVDLNLHGLAVPLPALLAIAVYRIVQELLNNVMKHAQAQEVFVQVSREENQLYLSVEDDGVGFDTGAETSLSGIGLAGIRTRVGLLGGTVSINSRPGRGTGFFLQVPIPAA